MLQRGLTNTLAQVSWEVYRIFAIVYEPVMDPRTSDFHPPPNNDHLMPSMNPEVEVYVKELSKLKYGYPLYDPDPAESYDRVRIGDVGYITDYGCFLRLFNVFYPEGHPINNLGVPDGFTPLNERYQRSHRSQALQPGVICSSHVRELGGGISLNGGTIPSGLTIRLSCTDEQGAALITKRGAIRDDSRCAKALRDLILKNYEAWHSFARDELQTDIAVKDIRLVTGHILTHEWATATIVEKTRDCEFQFNAGANSNPIGYASASMWGIWASSVRIPLRFGPTVLPPALPDAHNIVSNAHPDTRGVTQVANDSTVASVPSLEGTTNSQPNQCIFVRAYRIATRPFFLRKIKAAAFPKDEEDEGASGGYDPIVVKTEMDSDSDSGESEVDDPNKSLDMYEAAQNCIFTNSDADIAILHDDDVSHFNSERSLAGIFISDGRRANIPRGDERDAQAFGVHVEQVGSVMVASFDFDSRDPIGEGSDHDSTIDHFIDSGLRDDEESTSSSSSSPSSSPSSWCTPWSWSSISAWSSTTSLCSSAIDCEPDVPSSDNDLCDNERHIQSHDLILPTTNKVVKIDVISDFIDPWCYIGQLELQRALDNVREANLPVDFLVEYHPYSLLPMQVETIPISKQELLEKKLGKPRSEAMKKIVIERAKLFGVQLSFEGPTCSSVQSHRLIYYAYQKHGSKVQSALVGAIYKAFFEEDLDVASTPILATLAARSCVFESENDASAWLEGDELREHVQTIAIEAAKKINGVPLTVFAQKWCISGSQSYAVYEKVLKKLATSDLSSVPKHIAATKDTPMSLPVTNEKKGDDSALALDNVLTPPASVKKASTISIGMASA